MQSVSQRAIKRKKWISSRRPCRSMALWAGGKRVETTCRVLFGESPIRKKGSWIAGPKPGPNRAARRLRLDRNDGMPSRRVPKYPSTSVAAAAKSPFTTSPFRGDFFWESEKKGMRNPIRPSSAGRRAAPSPLVIPSSSSAAAPRFNSSDIGPDSF